MTPPKPRNSSVPHSGGRWKHRFLIKGAPGRSGAGPAGSSQLERKVKILGEKASKTCSVPGRSGASPEDSSPAPSRPRAARGSPPLCPPPGVALMSTVSTTTVRARSRSLHGFMPLMKLRHARHLWRSVKNVTVIVICNAKQQRHADREPQSTCSPPVAIAESTASLGMQHYKRKVSTKTPPAWPRPCSRMEHGLQLRILRLCVAEPYYVNCIPGRAPAPGWPFERWSRSPPSR